MAEGGGLPQEDLVLPYVDEVLLATIVEFGFPEVFF